MLIKCRNKFYKIQKVDKYVDTSHKSLGISLNKSIIRRKINYGITLIAHKNTLPKSIHTYSKINGRKTFNIQKDMGKLISK